MSNFSFLHIVFYWFGELPAIFIKQKAVVCKLFQFGSVLNLSFGKVLEMNLKFFFCPFILSSPNAFSFVQFESIYTICHKGSKDEDHLWTDDVLKML